MFGYLKCRIRVGYLEYTTKVGYLEYTTKVGYLEYTTKVGYLECKIREGYLRVQNKRRIYDDVTSDTQEKFIKHVHFTCLTLTYILRWLLWTGPSGS